MTEVKHDTKRSETQLIGECRIAYPFHFEKRTKTAGGAILKSPRNDAVLLVTKMGTAEACPNYAKLSGMCMEAAQKAWNGWPDGGKWPIQDGDQPHAHKPKPGEKALTPEQIQERNKWRVGSWVVEVATNLAQGPKVTILSNGVMQDIPAQDVGGVRLYKSGDYGYVSMNAYTFQRETWGVNFSYEGVAYTRPGELIGGGPKSSAQMFAGIPVSASAPAPGASGAAPRPPGPPALPTSAGAPASSAPASYAPPPAAPVAPAPPTAAPLPTSTLPTMTSPSSVPPGLPQLPPVPAR